MSWMTEPEEDRALVEHGSLVMLCIATSLTASVLMGGSWLSWWLMRAG